MPEPDLIDLFIEPFNRTGIEYMVSGAVAAILYGEPRLTNDIDVVAALDSSAARRFGDEFPPDEFYVPPPETLDEAVRQEHGHFNVIHIGSALKIDVYPAGGDALNAWGLMHRRDLRIGGRRVWTAPPEYVILLKLEYWRDGGSEKHARDIRAMLRILGPDIDRGMIADEAKRRGVVREWTIASS